VAFIDFSAAPVTYSTRFCGAKPADLPVEQSAKFGLVVNLIVAKGTRPRRATGAFARADEVISRATALVLLRCMSPEVALLGPFVMSDLSPQSGPKRTLMNPDCCHQSRFYEYTSQSLTARWKRGIISLLNK
jgi:hypothetical protein